MLSARRVRRIHSHNLLQPRRSCSCTAAGQPVVVVWPRRLGAVSGAAAVAAGAIGAHALPAHLRKQHDLPPEDVEMYSKIFETGARYHLVHAGVLLCAPWARFPAISGSLLFAGQVLFAGSLYTVAAAGTRDVLASSVAPVGGGLLILGWLSFAL